MCVFFYVPDVFLSLFSLLTPVGGGIPHGVCLESVGIGVALTQHSSCGVGRHVASHSSADAPLTRLANGIERAEGGGHNGGPAMHPSALNERKQCKRGNVGPPEPVSKREPEITKPDENCSAEAYTPDCIETEPETGSADTRKCSLNSSVEPEKAGERKRGRRGSGERMKVMFRSRSLDHHHQHPPQNSGLTRLLFHSFLCIFNIFLYSFECWWSSSQSVRFIHD